MEMKGTFKLVATFFVTAFAVLLLSLTGSCTPTYATPGAELQNVMVISFSGYVPVPDMPKRGHWIFMDTKKGDIWAYSQEALAGQEQPIYIGTLTALGRMVVRKQ